MIAVIDYGMGNLRSVSKALERVGASVTVTSDPAVIARADKLIVPGVGAFAAAMRELTVRKLVEPITTALKAGRPYLGICLGLQLLFERGEEGEGAAGLGILAGTVRKLSAANLKIPHMWWNEIRQKAKGKRQNECPLLEGIPEGSYFYFVHSYVAEPVDRAVVALETDYGQPFTAMVWKDRLFATQFHPEKSQLLGLRLLKNFIDL